MKKLLALSVLLATSVSVSANPPSGGFTDGSNRTVSTVQQALKAADDTPVTLVGYIVERVKNDDDEFIFQDKTGSIKIDVDDNAWKGQNVGPKDKVTIYGKVDTNGLIKSDIDVYHIEKH